ncbi:MAG: hypothetical protein RMI63_03265 [Caldimicrobium sp.]|nr:hypothetical protein [Caldimicrobium sp.]
MQSPLKRGRLRVLQGSCDGVFKGERDEFYIAVDKDVAVKEAIKEWRPFRDRDGMITFLLGMV